MPHISRPWAREWDGMWQQLFIGRMKNEKNQKTKKTNKKKNEGRNKTNVCLRVNESLQQYIQNIIVCFDQLRFIGIKVQVHVEYIVAIFYILTRIRIMIVVHHIAHATLEITHSIEFTSYREHVLTRIKKNLMYKRRTHRTQLTESKIGKFNARKKKIWLFSLLSPLVSQHPCCVLNQTNKSTHSLYIPKLVFFVFFATQVSNQNRILLFIPLCDRTQERTLICLCGTNCVAICKSQILMELNYPKLMFRLHENCSLLSTHNYSRWFISGIRLLRWFIVEKLQSARNVVLMRYLVMTVLRCFYLSPYHHIIKYHYVDFDKRVCASAHKKKLLRFTNEWSVYAYVRWTTPFVLFGHILFSYWCVWSVYLAKTNAMRVSA